MSAPADADRRPGWGFGDVGVTLLLALLLASVAAALATAVGPQSATGKAWASVVLVVVPWLGLAGWPLWAAWHKGDGPVSDYRLRFTRPDVGWGVLGGLAALVAGALVAAVVTALRGAPFGSAVGDVAAETTSASRGALVALALTAVVGAPVVEELAFRGLFYGALEKFGQPALWCVVWSSVAFAGFHFELVRFPVLLAIGLVIGVVRWRTGSTGAAMVAHLTVNLPAAVALATM
ncbi:MAG: CPBP family intramembrane metalloprotease [Actinomycetia bacterium]|nr:CPBP family intramembrane metalloprotease [Actinomycetes bacterium]